jgi:hypothetical protein
LHDLNLGIDAGPCTVAKAIPYNLSQVKHKLIVVFELVSLNTYNRTVVGNPNQKIATLGIEERGNVRKRMDLALAEG